MSKKFTAVWEPYFSDGDAYIMEELWGKDHLSVLVYCETRTVDHKGVLNGDHMRTNTRLHREMLGYMMYRRGVAYTDQYPTRIKDGVELSPHDDWSCLEDLIHAGYLTAETAMVRDLMFASHECRVKLTEAGVDLAQRLRLHKANGGNYANFVIQIVEKEKTI